MKVKTMERRLIVCNKVIYLMTAGDPGNDIYIAVYRRKIYRPWDKIQPVDEFWDVVPGFLSYGNSIDLDEEDTVDDRKLVEHLEHYVRTMLDNEIWFAEEVR